MAQINITVLSIEPKSAVSAKGKPYELVEIAYKNHSFQDKIESAKINQYNTVFSIAKTMQVGSSYEIVKEKDSSGYFQWLSILPTVNGIPANSPAAAYVARASGQQIPNPTPVAAAPYQAPPNRSFETSEERASKQVYIVKQSSLSNAIATLAIGSKTTPDKEKVIELAQAYTDFVFGKQPLVDMPNDLDDVPF
jgi:hypothetical protein